MPEKCWLYSYVIHYNKIKYIPYTMTYIFEYDTTDQTTEMSVWIWVHID